MKPNEFNMWISLRKAQTDVPHLTVCRHHGQAFGFTTWGWLSRTPDTGALYRTGVQRSRHGSSLGLEEPCHTRISCCFQRCLGFKWLENLQLLSMKSHLHAWAITRIPVGFQEANAGKPRVVTMSFTCHLQGQIHPCYHSSNLTVATPEMS